jgi:hypothetical protein
VAAPTINEITVRVPTFQSHSEFEPASPIRDAKTTKRVLMILTRATDIEWKEAINAFAPAAIFR